MTSFKRASFYTKMLEGHLKIIDAIRDWEEKGRKDPIMFIEVLEDIAWDAIEVFEREEDE
jgi:hypothetical protein